jgi:hypothetical protein
MAQISLVQHLSDLSPLLPFVLLVGGIFGLAVSLVVPPARFNFGLLIALAFLLAAGLGWLVLYANGADAYYMSGVSRWEHARRGGSQPIVVAAGAATAVTIVTLLVGSVERSRGGFRAFAVFSASLSCIFLVVAWFFLTTGH